MNCVKSEKRFKIVVFYFSGTGNTELIGREITKELKNLGHCAEIISIEDSEKIKSLDLSDKILGFGFPVYKFTYPDILDRAMPEILNKANSNMYFQFSTYARFDAQALYDFSIMLKAKKLTLIAQKSFKAPSCGISARRSRDDYEYESVMFFEDGIVEKIKCFTEQISKNAGNMQEVKSKPMFMGGLKKNVVAHIEITKYPKLHIDESKCTVCGICARHCPDNNLIHEKKLYFNT